MPKCVSTGEGNCDKDSFDFLHVCSVDMCGWSDREIHTSEEQFNMKAKAAVLTHCNSVLERKKA